MKKVFGNPRTRSFVARMGISFGSGVGDSISEGICACKMISPLSSRGGDGMNRSGDGDAEGTSMVANMCVDLLFTYLLGVYADALDGTVC